MGLETIAIVTASLVSAGSAVKSAQDQKKALKEQKKLEAQRKAELAEEEIARQQAQKKAASSGVRVGRSSLVSSSVTGMGSPNAPTIASMSTLFGN